MTVDAIDSVHGRATQTPADVWATKLAARLEEMRSSVSTAHQSPNVTTSAAYAPAVVAQAAALQMYTAAGSLAAQSSSSAASHSGHGHSIKEHPDDIQAVEGVDGSTVNALS